jgi:hypothetical protein
VTVGVIVAVTDGVFVIVGVGVGVTGVAVTLGVGVGVTGVGVTVGVILGVGVIVGVLVGVNDGGGKQVKISKYSHPFVSITFNMTCGAVLKIDGKG